MERTVPVRLCGDECLSVVPVAESYPWSLGACICLRAAGAWCVLSARPCQQRHAKRASLTCAASFPSAWQSPRAGRPQGLLLRRYARF